ncbi:MAG TPA: hypothetical protein VMS08_04065, partial [Candidatus Saccharimonadia bacterium]|nr:hypothetical protein [Candidatus Saccharimonadia bacterium]
MTILEVPLATQAEPHSQPTVHRRRRGRRRRPRLMLATVVALFALAFGAATAMVVASHSAAPPHPVA